MAGPRLEVHFQSDSISLEIPEDGLVLPNGWAIRPLGPLVVSAYIPAQRGDYMVTLTDSELCMGIRTIVQSKRLSHIHKMNLKSMIFLPSILFTHSFVPIPDFAFQQKLCSKI